MAQQKKVLIAGASSGVGVELTRLLRADGQQVIALIRASSNASALEQAGAKVLRGDVLDAAQVSRAFQDAGPLDAVVSIVGGRPFRKKEVPADYDGNRILIDATRSAGTKRFLLVSSIGAGGSRAAAPWIARLILGRFMALKTRAEEYLRSTSLDWTIVRPGHLKDGPASGKAQLTEDESASGSIMRADVALLVQQALRDPQSLRRTFSCVEPVR